MGGREEGVEGEGRVDVGGRERGRVEGEGRGKVGWRERGRVEG